MDFKVDYYKIRDIGDEVLKQNEDLVNTFSDLIKIINELKELGLNTNYTGPKIEVNENFNSKTFVITGTLTKYTRDEVEEKIELLGGKTSSSVSKKTTAVIVGENPGSKYDKALKIGIPIWSEEDLEEKF